MFQISLPERSRPSQRKRTEAIYVEGKRESVSSLTKRWEGAKPHIPGRPVCSRFRGCLLTHSVLGTNTLWRATVADHFYWRLRALFFQLFFDDVVPKRGKAEDTQLSEPSHDDSTTGASLSWLLPFQTIKQLWFYGNQCGINMASKR